MMSWCIFAIVTPRSASAGKSTVRESNECHALSASRKIESGVKFGREEILPWRHRPKLRRKVRCNCSAAAKPKRDRLTIPAKVANLPTAPVGLNFTDRSSETSAFDKCRHCSQLGQNAMGTKSREAKERLVRFFKSPRATRCTPEVKGNRMVLERSRKTWRILLLYLTLGSRTTQICRVQTLHLNQHALCYRR